MRNENDIQLLLVGLLASFIIILGFLILPNSNDEISDNTSELLEQRQEEAEQDDLRAYHGDTFIFE